MMKAFVTVSGKDKAGIIAGISTLLAKERVNIENVSQTITRDNFTMTMRVNMSWCPLSFDELANLLAHKGEKIGVTITLRYEDIFDAMRRV